MAAILVFDVNETMLDLSSLVPRFDKAFGRPGVMGEWFVQVLQYAEALTLTNAYRPFNEVAMATLQMVAQSKGIEVAAADAQSIAAGFRELSPHKEVPAALSRLKEAGYRMVTLGNSPAAVIDAQMAYAKLQPCFERTFSVDTVSRYKPAPEAYRLVAREMDVNPRDLLMIAAHAWDVGGAAQAGLRTGFIARPGHAAFPLFHKPDFSGNDLAELATAIIAAKA